MAVSRRCWATRSAIDDGLSIGDGCWTLDRVREAMESPSTIYLDAVGGWVWVLTQQLVLWATQQPTGVVPSVPPG